MRTHVQACFDQRMKAWQRWQDAQNMLQKKRETEAKLLWANKPDKLQQAKDEITEVTLTRKPNDMLHDHTLCNKTEPHNNSSCLVPFYLSFEINFLIIFKSWKIFRSESSVCVYAEADTIFEYGICLTLFPRTKYLGVCLGVCVGCGGCLGVCGLDMSNRSFQFSRRSPHVADVSDDVCCSGSLRSVSTRETSREYPPPYERKSSGSR